MKMKIDVYEVDIKAKFISEDCCNKEALFYLLNDLSLLAMEAARIYDNEGCHALADEARGFQKDINNYKNNF